MSTHLISPCVKAVTVLVIGLIGTSALTAQEKGRSRLPEDLALVGRAAAFARLEVGRAWHGPEAAVLKKACQAHPVILLWEGHGLEKSLGLKYSDIDRVVVIISDFKDMSAAVAILTTREPFDRDKVVNSLVPGGKERKVKEKSYTAGDKDGFAVHVLDKRSLVIGNAAGIEAFLIKPTEEADVLSETVTAAAEKPLLAVGIDPRSFAPAIATAGKDAQAFLPLFRAKCWQVTTAETDELVIRFRFTFADEAAAKEAMPAVTAAIAPLDWYLGVTENEFPAFLKREVDQYPGAADLTEPFVGTIKALRAALKDLKPVQEGAVVRADLRVKTKTPATALLMITTLAPRAKKN